MSRLKTADSIDQAWIDFQSHADRHPQRNRCNICDRERSNQDQIATFHCNLRAFATEAFPVWRCSSCQTIHCLDVVNLAEYYQGYPYERLKLGFPLTLLYRNRLAYLKKFGLSKHHRILDYGCGSKGLFIEYLQQKHYPQSFGYDPYSSPDTYGNPTVLEKQPFDFILLQDVIEHVEDPLPLLDQLNEWLAPGGKIVIGTPNAATLDLDRPDISDYGNAIHVPCHLHIYTKETLETLVQPHAWQRINFVNRPFSDTRWPGLNIRALNEYQQLGDGSIDTIFEPINLCKIIKSPKALYYAILGYWQSHFTDMTLTFTKPS